MEKGNRARTGGLKRGLEVGAVTVERVVHGRYEWRDGGMRPTDDRCKEGDVAIRRNRKNTQMVTTRNGNNDKP